MVIVHLGHVPFERHHHVGLFRAYARRAAVVYLEMGETRSGAAGAPAAGAGAAPATPPAGAGLEVRRFRPRLPGSRYAGVARWNWWLAARAALAGVRREGPRDRVLVVQTPDLLPTLTGLDADLTAYLIVDDYVGLAPAPRRDAVARAHARLARRADLVWAISGPLLDEARTHRPDVHPTTTGVDHAAFAVAAGLPPPPGLAALPAPRVGTVGNLNDRIDWDLAEGIARARPAWSLVFVGPLYLAGRVTHEAVARLRRLPNVHFLPEVAPDDLPGAVAGLDVGLVLYRPGAGTLGINPLKLYQYLAAGRPVVATPLPVFEGFRDVVRVAATAAGFAGAIEAELAAPDPAGRAAGRRRRALEFDWERVAEDRLALLAARLEARGGGSPGRPGGAGLPFR